MIIKGNKRLNKVEFKVEKELQSYVEKNMSEILNCKFIDTEVAVGNIRLDSLGYDEENNAFVIVEYKKVENAGLVDQGYSYLALMLDRKEAFVLRYNNVTKQNKEAKDFDWSQTRIIFVSPYFTQRQIESTSFSNMPFDLIKATKYEDDIYEFETIGKNENIKADFNIESESVRKVNKEIKVYTEAELLSKTSVEMQELYNKLKEAVLSLGDINVKPTKLYIAFKGKGNIFDVEPYKNFLKLTINLKKGEMVDQLGITRLVDEIGHHGNGDYELKLDKEEQIEDIMYLIKQSYKINQ